MSPYSLTRLLLRLVGLALLVTSVPAVFSSVWAYLAYLVEASGSTSTTMGYAARQVLAELIASNAAGFLWIAKIVLGNYLLFGNRWLARWLVRGLDDGLVRL
jgi:hypothetical protein